MALNIIKFDPETPVDENRGYHPVLTIIRNKIYRIESWTQLFKILLYTYCYKKNNCERLKKDINVVMPPSRRILISNKEREESDKYTKFSPDLYFRVFSAGSGNYSLLRKINAYSYTKKLVVYLAMYDSFKELDNLGPQTDLLIESLQGERNYQFGNTKYMVARINGTILSAEEMLIRRIEKEFDQKKLIGDIRMTDAEDEILKEYMKEALNRIISNKPLTHEKVFAFGLVRLALKNYANKTYWQFFKKEYGISPNVNQQDKIKSQFKTTLKKYNKPFDETNNGSFQNICMHAFVCDKCAAQFFGYIFDFWRIDLSRNLENSYIGEDEDLFDILIDEIQSRPQDIMIHTVMALRMNPGGCKNRFRRVLKMIDNSYWNNTDYSEGDNRMNILFNQWKNNPKGPFIKEVNKRASGRQRGRGERRHSRPYIVFNPIVNAFKMILPRQLLRGCTEEEHPVWYISADNYEQSIEPPLLKGKAFLFTDDCSVNLARNQIFKELTITLRSETTKYCVRRIKEGNARFYNDKNEMREIIKDTVTKDISYILVNKGREIIYANGTFIQADTTFREFDIYQIRPSVGDVLITPEGSPVSVGSTLSEGIIGNNRSEGVNALYEDDEYPVVTDRERLFFKTEQKKLNGTLIRIYVHNRLEYEGKIIDKKYLELKLTDSTKNIYGYIIDLHDFIFKNGIYKIELDIPGRSLKTYKACYIKGFTYQYLNAPYLFEVFGRISFPKHLDFVLNDDWDISQDTNVLEFSIKEDLEKGNEYVIDRKLLLDYSLNEDIVTLSFDFPVLYWKYTQKDEWQLDNPNDITVKNLPERIYVSGDIDLSSAKLTYVDNRDMENFEIGTNYDHITKLYYFRIIDMIEFLNRDKTYRKIHIQIGEKASPFFTVICKSIVRSRNLFGDFSSNRIYGNFDISGDSDYTVTLKKGDELIEEDVPVINGNFEIEHAVQGGEYTVTLYEFEDDDSGFGAISYELESYKLKLVDVRHLDGKVLRIKSIQSIDGGPSGISLFDDYYVVNLVRVDYESKLKDAGLYVWRLDAEKMPSYVYYRGQLSVKTWVKGVIKLKEAIVIFDNLNNPKEAIINVGPLDDLEGLTYSPDRHKLQPDSRKLNKHEKTRCIMIDDDKYKIIVEIR